ncbi:CheR family methyltransferase [Hyalangium rubrum]|uniref:protein-glutamate O-methyltransferase n=1 Tax=Hyalangium rubrum TaxID=3103134 RepID=A0ABU5GWA0_9BACT|nr:protein-glutamate O-methyltransferase CheR [Hyalangium sp. s54d21]MDY7225467.1 protein-glutamate O-methyltransferase CheR [Hyalangium sp. s54d21]
MSLCAEDFLYLQRQVQRLSGIHLEPQSRDLVETRLMPLLRQEGLAQPCELVARLRALPEGHPFHHRVLEALTNHETAFFRDFPVFEALRGTVLPELLARRERTRELNIWCAACSFGQEPYSIAMLLEEAAAQLEGWTVRLLATDLSESALNRARAGRYGQQEINRGLPARLLVKYFRQERGQWTLHEDIRRRVEFRALNLVQDFLLPGEMDLIFLRNVMIYWDTPTRKAVLGRMRNRLAGDGYLVLGGAETTLHLDSDFERVHLHQSSWYRRRGPPQRGG